MKKILLLISVFYSVASAAQDFWNESEPFVLNPQYHVKSISIVDENVVWVLGSDSNNPDYFDRFSISLNGGLNWTDGLINIGNFNRHSSNIHAISNTIALHLCLCYRRYRARWHLAHDRRWHQLDETTQRIIQHYL